MDNTQLRRLTSAQTAASLRQHRTTLSDDAVSTHLLRSIESQALAPSILSTWLTITQSPALVATCLSTSFSAAVRAAAVKSLGRLWRGRQWRTLWAALGGTRGLLEHMAEMSVVEVKAVAKALGRMSPVDGDARARQVVVTELFKALHPRYYGDVPIRSADARDLTHQYRVLIAACTSEFVEQYFRAHGDALGLLHKTARRQLLNNHYEVVGRMIDETLFGGRERLVRDPARYIDAIVESGSHEPSPVPGLSGPSYYLFSLFRRLAQSDSDLPPGFSLVRNVLAPLLRRAHKLSPEVKLTIIDLAIRYLSIHPKERDCLVLAGHDKGSLIWHVVTHWGKDPENFDSRLSSILRTTNRNNDHDLLSRYHELLGLVPRDRRYTLLQTLFLQNPVKSLSLHRLDDLAKLATTRWPVKMFLDMPPSDAVPLLKRLSDIHTKQDFLVPPPGTIHQSCTHAYQGIPLACQRVDSEVLLCALRRGRDYELAKELVDARCKLASAARDQPVRAFEAKAALLLAAASGSIALLGDTLAWARRLSRDPLTAKTIFGADVLLRPEAVRTLSGLPFDSTGSLDLGGAEHTLILAEIKSSAAKANEVLMQLLDLAVSAIREPSFSSGDWEAVRATFEYVAWERIKQACHVKRCLALADEQLYDALFKSTLSTLLRAEEIGLAESNKALEFNGAFGPASVGYRFLDLQDLGDTPAAAYTFIDELAKARDALWREHRASITPAVVALPSPWPRGLPLQCLIRPFDIAVPAADGHTPYIADRAKSIVFADPSLMMASAPGDDDKDRELKETIGCFIDAYGIALKIYVDQAPSKSARVERCAAAVNHLLDNFRRGPHDAATSHEAAPDAEFLRLCGYVSEHLPLELLCEALQKDTEDFEPVSRPYNYPLIPEDADPNVQDEWDPNELKPADTKSKPVTELVNLDYFLEAGRLNAFWYTDIFAESLTPEIFTAAVSFPTVFESRGTKAKAHLVREAQIAVSLLYLDAMGKGSPRVLASAFPSPDDARFPPLFLSIDFLGKTTEHDKALHSLAELRCLRAVPPSLLAQLVSSAWSQYLSMSKADSKIYLRERVAYQLLRLLTLSDAPQLASSLILRAVLDHPDASSWHRLVLSPRFLRRMSASRVRAFMASFADEIRQKLALQSKSNSKPDAGTGDEAQPAQKAPAVKVTTVKYLAQLLDRSNFIAPRFALDLLGGLFEDARHIDIRTAIVESLLGMLRANTGVVDRAFAERILDVLERVVPVAASLDERKPLSDQEMLDAEDRLELPTVWSEGQRFDINRPPILDLLVGFDASGSWLGDVYMQRIIVPVIEQSCENNARWLRMFAKSTGFLAFAELPALPVKPGILRKALSMPGAKPFSLVERQHAFVMLNLKPPSALRDDINKLHADKVRKSAAGLHALSLVDRKLAALEADDFWVPCSLFSSLKYDGLEHDAACKRLYDLALEEAQSVIFDHGGKDLRAWNMLTSGIKTRFGSLAAGSGTSCPWQYDSRSDQRTRSQATMWTYGRPWIDRVLSLIEHLRDNDDAWKSNPDRTPKLLPPTLAMRLHTLVINRLAGPHQTIKERQLGFADLIVRLIDRVLEYPQYWDQYPLVQSAAQQIDVSDYAFVAHAIATHDPSRTPLSTEQALEPWLQPSCSHPATKASKPDINNPDRALYMRIDVAQMLIRRCTGGVREDGDVCLVVDLLDALQDG
ncbi:hypothetical protein EJ05DRAFT_139577 [Pseudovirgaria hyperparasitica]|uniref:Uncharacterized protein n=1 Tax=Pseudovirgaria hyperparasitica TaxID=470096 RepID=A0A6A6VVW0_9PEZI|nr:uncharacterized protein EJ05DRAFT_139577 [Pseudovirgaria hyperparasitica]KAF2754373.1 hypothetical protein EJ05DRAFT_139577 [Pseudovirgaria hyperparasitica]